MPLNSKLPPMSGASYQGQGEPSAAPDCDKHTPFQTLHVVRRGRTSAVRLGSAGAARPWRSDARGMDVVGNRLDPGQCPWMDDRAPRAPPVLSTSRDRSGRLAVVALSIVAASVLGLPALGVATTGEIPAGLPTLEGPELRLHDIEGIVPLAAGCLLLAYIESVSAGRTFAAKHGYGLDPRQELLGIGAANFAAALGHGYPVAGGCRGNFEIHMKTMMPIARGRGDRRA
jgi:hypothetical protein